MRRPSELAALAGFVLLAGCGADMPSMPWSPAPPQVAAAPAAVPAAVEAAPAAVDAGTALVEARRCGRAIAVAARCNYLRDDRDAAALRFTVLQGLGQRHGEVVEQPRLTEAVDLAVLDRMATLGQCAIAPADMAVVESGLREVLGSCAAP